VLEATSQMEYRDLIVNDAILNKLTSVPKIYTELSTKRVLTSEWVDGIAIDKTVQLSQSTRNDLARTVLTMTIKELFEWRFMQSDPNYGNFLFNVDKNMINLIDFGAARKYSKSFVDGYMKLVWAAANNDKDTIYSVSKDLGFFIITFLIFFF
jgi:aarF domain-containing kinase